MTDYKTSSSYTVSVATAVFDITFDYLTKGYVKVYLNSVLQTYGTDYDFASSTQIRFLAGNVPVGSQVLLRRVTATSPLLVTWQDASVLRARELSLAQLQLLHVAEEGRESAFDAVGRGSDGEFTASGNRITDLESPVNDLDAVNKAWMVTQLALAITKYTGNIGNAVGVSFLSPAGVLTDLQKLSLSAGINLIGSDDGTLADSLGLLKAREQYPHCNTVATLLALDSTKFKRCKLLGYYAAGDTGSSRDFYVVPGDTTTAANFGTSFRATDGALWVSVQKSVVTTAEFGARPAPYDSSAALQRWFAYGMEGGVRMRISPFRHYSSTSLTWDFAKVATVGACIRGYSPAKSIIELAAGQSMSWIGSNSTALFYLMYEGFNVITNIAGVGVRIGADDCSDAFNSCHFRKVVFNNSNLGSAAVTLRLNYVLQATGDIVVNGGGSGRPQSTVAKSAGTALMLYQLQFSSLSIAAGNADKGIYATGGYTHGNIFMSTDVEEVNYAVIVDGVNVTGNTFVGGTFIGYNIFSASAGAANRFLNVHLAAYPSADGKTAGTVIVGTPVGMSVSSPQLPWTVSSAPTFPASTAYWTNTYCRPVVLHVAGGTVSAITYKTVGGLEIPIPVGTWYGKDLHVREGDSIKFTYSATPAWAITPAD